MCGIAGIVGNRNRDAALTGTARMLEVLRRRGPDDSGIEMWATAVLGHRRLSIFDLSPAGHQPMLSPDKSVGVVFNGAIYNFRSLRLQLEKKGFHFVSQTDTEVLIHGYREWGFDELVKKLDGMFAIGLWDDDLRTLYLVRDRLGVKPIAYALGDGHLAFASNVRALKIAGYGSGVDLDALTEYLEFGFITDEHCIHKGISKVAANEIIEWHEGKIKKRTYWDPRPDNSEQIGFEDAVRETEGLLLKAVEKRLQADVPVGALLSGGIDSSLVCWAVSKLGGDVTAFTVGTPADGSINEAGTAARTARALGVRHRILDLSPTDAPNVESLSDAFAEPFACASALGMLEISKEVKAHATVLLTGDGGDDIFLGYPEHRHFLLSTGLANKTPYFSARLWRMTRGAVPQVGALKRGTSFVDYSVGGLGAVTSARDGLPVYKAHRLLGEKLKEKSVPDREIEWSIGSARNLLSEFLDYDRKTRFVGEYLPKVDGSTMIHSLEARSPFLDKDLWEFANTLPFTLRLHKGRSKAILREIARRNIGESLSRGKKQGFIIPVQRWLTGHWRDHFISLMSGSRSQAEGWIDARAALSLLEGQKPGTWAPRQLWFIFVLESWLRYERQLELP